MLNTMGKICLTWSGKTPQLILVEPEMVKEVLSNKSGNFPIPDVQGLLKVLGLGTGLPGLKGEEWANRRRLINPAFHMEKLKSLLPLFASSCSELVQRWEKSIGPQGSCELDVWVELQNLTADVISRAAFGSSYEEGKHIFQMQKKLEEMAAELLNVLSIPVLRFVKMKKNRRREELKEKMTSLLSKIIEKREQEMKLGTANNDDLLGILLESNKNHREYGSRGMTRDEIIEECKVFYSAGHESTSELLTWTMVLLSMNPSWQMHARDEVLKVCGRHAPSFDNLAQLKIMTMIIYEVLRLYPPAVMLGRETYSTVKLGDITLPAGVGLVVPILLIHHDHTLWGDDADKFKPERFSEGVANATKNRLMFLPFSWGPRICIGQTFALNEAKMALAMILQSFTFELSPSYTHAPHTILTLQPQYGAQIILHKL
ncbi:cytochrome P450 72A397-like isoform X1 [Nymphaea colorata]|nr:cytochrome P450 72A397-like isoform X1 [Nymphaea colorata]